MPSTQHCDHQTHSSKNPWDRREEGKQERGGRATSWPSFSGPAGRLPISEMLDFYSEAWGKVLGAFSNPQISISSGLAHPPSCVFQGKAIFMGQEERMLSSLSPINIYVRTDIEILEGTKSDFFISSTQGGPEEYDGLALRKPGRCSQTKPHSAFYIVLICLHPALWKEKKELLIIYYLPELKIAE